MPVVRQTIYSTHDGNTLLQQIVQWKSVQREEAEAEVTGIRGTAKWAAYAGSRYRGKQVVSLPCRSRYPFRYQPCDHLSPHGCRNHPGFTTSWAYYYPQVWHWKDVRQRTRLQEAQLWTEADCTLLHHEWGIGEIPNPEENPLPQMQAV